MKNYQTTPKHRAQFTGALGRALDSIAALPLGPALFGQSRVSDPVAAPSPTRAKIKAVQERELQLEAEIAIIKLERNSLLERVAMLQRMIKEG